MNRHRRLNPSSPSFTKAGPTYGGIWQRGGRGDFGRICLVNYGRLVSLTIKAGNSCWVSPNISYIASLASFINLSTQYGITAKRGMFVARNMNS
jgi:hypothetical protein